MILPPWLVRNLTFPIYERLRGRTTVQLLSDYRRLLRQSPTEVAEHAQKLLLKTLDFAAAHLPFYRDHFALLPVTPSCVPPDEFVRRLPVLTKDEVRAAGEDMVNWDAPGGLKHGYTGGTTGDRLQFWVSPNYGSQNMAARLVMQEQFGVALGESRAYLWGNPIETRTAGMRRWRDWLINDHLLDAFQMSEPDMDAHLQTLRRIKPRVLYGYPSALTRLAEHAAQRGNLDDFAFMKLVVATGEMLNDVQRQLIRAAFDCPVAAEYGAREVGLIAHECPHGNLHIFTPIVHVEILNRGRSVPSGQPGEVICTTVSNKAQPMIHYRLGDVGALTDEACPCGLPLPTMRLEAGKILGFIALPDGRLCNGAVTSHVLRDLEGIVHYRTHQHAVTHFTVWLQVDDTFQASTERLILTRYQRLFGPECTVDVRIVPELPPDPSGKRRYVVSDIAPDYADLELADASAMAEHALSE